MTVKWYGAENMAAVKAAAFKGVVKGTELVRTEAIHLVLDTPKSGRVYHSGAITHQASAPGEPPATDTGNFVNQITTEFSMSDVSGVVNFGAKYSAWLEYGTIKMEPRPFARPALANKQSEIEAIVDAEIRAVLT
jgi:HK97 gp10 family phage protein